MPSENEPVRKLSSYDAMNFWAKDRDSTDVTASFRIHQKPLHKATSKVSNADYMDLPFQRQIKPKCLTLSFSNNASSPSNSSSSTSSTLPPLPFMQSSRDVEMNVMKRALESQDSQHWRQIEELKQGLAKMKEQRDQAWKINVALAQYCKNK